MRTHRFVRPLAGLAAAAGLFAGICHADEVARAPFALYVNGVASGDATVLLESHGTWVETSSLRHAGLTCFGERERTEQGTSFVPLASLAPMVTFTLDEAAVALRLTVDAGCFPPKVINAANAKPADIVYSRDRSAFFNYGLNGRTDGTGELALEAGGSVGGALASSQVTALSNGRFVRGLTQLTIDSRESLRRLVVGDAPVRADVLGGGGIIGGITFEKQLDLDPYFVPYPTVDLSGTVTTPSTVDVFVNDRLVRREQVAPGTFQIGGLPVAGGSGDTRMVIEDAFGHTHEVSSPYYLATSLLGKGVQEYRYSMGAVRRFGANNWDYGPIGFTGTHRVGLTSSLTVGMRLEATARLVSGGPSVNLRIARLGEIGLQLAASRTPDTRGSALSLAYSRTGGSFSLGGLMRLATDRYVTSSTGPTDPNYRFQLQVYAGVPLGSRGTVSIRHAVSRAAANGPNNADLRREATSLYASVQLARRASVFVSAGRVTDARGSGPAVSAGVTLLPRNGLSARLAYDEQNGMKSRSAEVQRSLTTADGYGYRVSVADGGGPSGAGVQYQTQHGRYEARYDSLNGSHSGAFRITGGVIAIGGGLFATRPVDGAFALLEVPGLSGVRGYASHQEVGRTNRNGQILVTNLLPNYGNVLSVEESDLPFEYSLPQARKVVAPPHRGGAVVRFAGAHIQRIMGTVHVIRRGETTAPAFGRLLLADQESPVGADGQFYFENISPGRHQARLEYDGRVCEIEVSVPSSVDPIVTLDDLSCSMKEDQ